MSGQSKIRHECRFCGKEFFRYPSWPAVYCSTRCQADHYQSKRVEMFWQQADKTESCWNWTGTICHTGYGQLCIKRKSVLAHRYAYEITHGPIPEGLFVCHSCDNRRCVNPAHLFLGSHEDNMRDRNEKGRQVRGEKFPQTRLTENIVREVRNLRSQGWTYRKIASHLDLPLRPVERVGGGISWKHVK